MLRRFAIPTLALVLASTSVSISSASAASGLSSLERDELAYSYRQLVNQYYREVNTQRALDGARSKMLALLQHDGVKKPTLPQLHATNDPPSDERALTAAVNAAVAKYGSKAPSRLVTYAAIAGLLSSTGDRYTTFLTPKEYAELNAGLDAQSFGGVGLSIGIDEATKLLKVESVIEDGPAEKVGIQSDDTIASIDGKSTKGKSLDDDSKMLRGKPGTIVRLVILRDGKTMPLSVTRAEIKPPSVTAKLLDGDIGYTRLAVFGSTTADELGAAIKRLNAEGAKAYILDLRDNGGGYLNAAIDVSSQFIATGPIVSVAERTGSTREYDADDVATSPKPLVVLVNKYTASASEITSGAIQDDGVGTLVGTKTFGKGVVQTIFPLPDGAAVKITTARYLTPAGRDINDVGIMPNIIVQENKDARYGDPSTDTQLDTAISVLHEKIADNSAD